MEKNSDQGVGVFGFLHVVKNGLNARVRHFKKSSDIWFRLREFQFRELNGIDKGVKVGGSPVLDGESCDYSDASSNGLQGGVDVLQSCGACGVEIGQVNAPLKTATVPAWSDMHGTREEKLAVLFAGLFLMCKSPEFADVVIKAYGDHCRSGMPADVNSLIPCWWPLPGGNEP